LADDTRLGHCRPAAELEGDCYRTELENPMTLPVKDPGESVFMEFDFTADLPTIAAATVTITPDARGGDPNAAAMLVGAHQIVGTVVRQRVQGGIAGVAYIPRCVATNGADVRVLADVLRVQWAGG